MHNLCYDVNKILNIKCLECNKNILNNSDFKYIDDNQLNEIINNYNNNFINNYNIHVNCINIKYLIKIIADGKINIITKNIFNKIVFYVIKNLDLILINTHLNLIWNI